MERVEYGGASGLKQVSTRTPGLSERARAVKGGNAENDGGGGGEEWMLVIRLVRWRSISRE